MNDFFFQSDSLGSLTFQNKENCCFNAVGGVAVALRAVESGPLQPGVDPLDLTLAACLGPRLGRHVIVDAQITEYIL